MNNIREKMKSKRGMTLIEVVVSFAIIAVVSVVIIIGFRTMGGLLQDSSAIGRLDQELEQDIATSTQAAVNTPAEINISGNTITIKGNIKEYEITEGSKTQRFKVFSTD